MKAKLRILAACWVLLCYSLIGLSLTNASPAKSYKGCRTGDTNAVWVLEQFDKLADPPGSAAWLSYADVKT